MKLRFTLICFSLIAPLLLLTAADQPKEKESGEDAYMKKEFAQMETMLRGQVDMIYGVISKQEYADKTAKVYALHRDALLKEGFSREETMSLLLSDNYFLKLQGKK